MAFSQFNDEWVENKVMFQLVGGGGCACCGMASRLPISQLIAQCTDIETDDARADDRSPWPQVVREMVWKDRVVMRQSLKRECQWFRDIWSQHADAFCSFWQALPLTERKRLFQLSVKELHLVFKDSIEKFDQTYQMMMLTIIEQVQNFEMTLLPPDAPYEGSPEHDVELALKGSKQAFWLDEQYLQKDSRESGFLSRFQEMQNEHILQRNRKHKKREEDDDEDEDDEEPDDDKKADPPVGNASQSFRPDRRIVRLLIFRLLARNVTRKFLASSGGKAGAGTT